jgi:4-amino-4-deoxy-L-arabinose transferase-like glycosyltransferase
VRLGVRLWWKVSSKEWLKLAALFIALTVLHLWSLMRFPPPFVDEAWQGSRAWALIHTGRAFGPLDVGVFDRFEGHWTFFPWLPAWIQSLGLRLSDTPGLFALRVVSLVSGLVLLGAVYAIANRLGGKRLGLLSVFLVSVSWPSFTSAHAARYDTLAAAFGFVAIALYLSDQSSRWWMGLLSGLCVGLAFEIHSHSAIYGPALVALYFLHWRWSVFRKPHFWSFVVGVAAGLMFYTAIHILPYPQTYVALSRLAFGPTHVPPLLTLEPRVLVQAFYDMGLLLLRAYQPLIPIIVWAVVVLVRRRSDADKTLLVLALVLVIGATLLIRNKFLYYAILFSPAIDVAVAVLLLRSFQQRWQRRLRDYLSRVLVWGLSVGSIALNLSVLPTDYGEAYQSVQSRINEVIHPGDSIIGPQTYWFGLYDHVYYSWEELVYYQRYAPGSTVEDALRELLPDVFIIDRDLDVWISDEPGDSLYSQHLRLPRTELETFLSRHARLVVEFDGGYYGRVRVYRIMWAGSCYPHRQPTEAGVPLISGCQISARCGG